MLDNEHQNIKVALIFCFKLYKLLLQLRKQFLTRILVCKYGHLLENPTSYSSTKHNSQSCLSTNYTLLTLIVFSKHPIGRFYAGYTAQVVTRRICTCKNEKDNGNQVINSNFRAMSYEVV